LLSKSVVVLIQNFILEYGFMSIFRDDKCGMNPFKVAIEESALKSFFISKI